MLFDCFTTAGFGAAAFMKPLLQNLCLSLGNNEEVGV
jgi:alpha-glucan,water dikinase